MTRYKMDIHSYDTSNHVVCMCVMGWRSQQKVSTKVQRFGTPTGVLEILRNITPIKEFLFVEAVRGSYRITVSGLWHVNPVGSFEKTKSHVDACNDARRFLSLLQVSADRIKKTKVFERNFECRNRDKKNVIKSESVPNQNTVKVYTNGSKLNGRVGAGFYAEYPNSSPKQAFFHLGIYSPTVISVNSISISSISPDHPISTKNLPISRFSSKFFEFKN